LSLLSSDLLVLYWIDADARLRRIRQYERPMAYFGIDSTNVKRVDVGDYLNGRMEELYQIINNEIDNGAPCLLRLKDDPNDPDSGHSTVITGYRRVGDHVEYTIHFGTKGYHPWITWRLDETINVGETTREWNVIETREIRYGFRPYDPNHTPVYNKIAEIDSEQYDCSGVSISWNGTEFEVLIANADKGELMFSQVHRDGDLLAAPIRIWEDTDSIDRPVLTWGNSAYGIVWCESQTSGITYFNLMSQDGRLLIDDNIILSRTCNQPRMTWANGEFCIVQERDKNIWLYRIHESIESPVSMPVRLGEGNSPDVCAYGNCYWSTWTDDNTLNVAMIEQGTGIIVESDSRVFSDTIDLFEPRLTCFNDLLAIVVKDNNNTLHLCQVNQQARFVSSTPIMLNTVKVSGQCQISSIDGDIWITFKNNDVVYLAVLSHQGEVKKLLRIAEFNTWVEHAFGEKKFVNLLVSRRVKDYKNDSFDYFNFELETCSLPLIPTQIE
ncbi:hypothetical protein ACFL3Q_11440, partial [Planctomycetota bacterium]